MVGRNTAGYLKGGHCYEALSYKSASRQHDMLAVYRLVEQ